jgi:pimeloyl-ACP methyl ester carboxylesterase
VLVLDCRGHGKSDKPPGPYTAELFAQDLADVLDELGWERIVVAGASMGGCVSLAFAQAYPDRVAGLGLFDTTACYGDGAPKAWAERAEKALTEGLEGLIDFKKTRWFSDKFRAEHDDVVQQCIDVFLANELPAYAVAVGVPALLCIFVVLWRLWRVREDRAEWAALLVFLGLTAVVMLAQVRGARLAVMPAMPAAAWLIVTARQRYLAAPAPAPLSG